MGLTKLGFGFMRLPVLDESNRSTVDLEEVKTMVDCFMERGFAYFDTAHRYHDEVSESVLCKTLTKRYSRNNFVLANKITLNYIKKPEDQEAFFKQQLSLCGVDYFDNYLIHNMGSVWYPEAVRFGTFDFIESMRKAGYTRNTGISFHGTAGVLDDILQEHPEVDIVQLQLNYLDWKDASIQSQRCYEVARKHGKRIVVMEPVKGGMLINLPPEAAAILSALDPHASLASWAIRFAAGLDGVDTVLSGMSTLEQIRDNTNCMLQFQPLSVYEHTQLIKVAELIHLQATIACTNCRYCTAECPQNIAIPDYFSLFNNMMSLKNPSYLANQPVYYANLTHSHAKASECIQCGKCEKNCPQNLPIRELLQKVAAAME